MLPIKKLYIDTRMRSKDSVSTADFSVDLPNNLEMLENSVYYIDDVTIPVSWYNISARNNKLYVMVHPSPSTGPPNQFELMIPVGNYNLTSLANAINLALSPYLN